MERIGQQLKAAREGQGITLAQVQQKTKIRMRYLEAIERGAFDVVPGEVYLKGFIRSYCRVVGVDSEALLEQYQELRAPESQGQALAGSRPRTWRFSTLLHGSNGTTHRMGH